MSQTAFRIKFFILMLFLCNFIHVLNANAATINAASCSQADVQAAIDSANDGDTVIVPRGECTWTTPVTIGEQIDWNPPVYESKSIILQGAGIDETVIIGGAGLGAVLGIKGVDGKTFRVTGFTFDGRNSHDWGFMAIGGTSKSFRVDNNKFINIRGRGLSIANKADSESTYGVIDHNIFIAPYNTSAQGVAIIGDGDTAWQRNLTLGTANAVYVEDNTFDFSYPYDTGLDAYGGARYVFRYNTVIGVQVAHHGFDTGGYRSTHSFEIYNNTFSTSFSVARTMHLRGGTGVIFNNTITGSYGGMQVNYYRSCYNSDHIDCGGTTTWGHCITPKRCDGTSPYDGNEDATGYPCLDQIGRTTDSNNDGIQDLEPLYEWNNTRNGADADISVHNWTGCDNPSAYDHIKEGRDYYNDTVRPGYTPYEYPHPLTITTPGDTTPPADVTNFTATAGDAQVTLTWTNPGDSDFVGTMIRYRTDGTYPVNHNDGTLVCERPAAPGSEHSFTHTGLQNGITCYYSAFTYDEVPNYSETAHASATPTADGPPLDTIDPTIGITSPTLGTTYSTEEDTITLGGSASDDVGVTTVTWTNNRGGSGTASGTTTWTISALPLQCGDHNTITVTARDAAGNSAMDTLTLDVKPCAVSDFREQ